MGMSSHVVGFRIADERWDNMKAVYDACQVGLVPIPSEVLAFFNWEEPQEKGLQINLEGTAAVKYEHENQNGFDVSLDLLPEGITHIRFYNSC